MFAINPLAFMLIFLYNEYVNERTTMNATKPITRVTPEGYIVEVADNNVIGFKCMGCSTTHIADESASVDELVEMIGQAQDTHKYC